ncbi:Wzz/FepE/Etk N-terminal domain-containing protein [Alcaligenes nematophilus]|uniref:Wzz/FepE/Etk N-terminal domain-containing protein n=1 Tax=Alcaligenes nematophilus TaxID=2994643 RepID=A0ABU3MWK8_9BURK|nr:MULTISPECIES: Wzz/FepE/Etk N-terminal domain-containing protein [Alcaligenes]MDT8466009.1 Wzz/FepE/Etk N-terminal domain-containing protein [Alcaligenes nematophilus]MDT8468517.1 Wzz/FepE/Etk N-terminal domain-containing protein [Alcaligenes nematophilus]MDT8504714.1 Wzz/FepE/Etk N-terminal domain-containing protein [Alcaligenes nematophilus]MDT8524938.1 Wzz/FepE/Etk N-terminal domain-containing protein [Alcaligenes nematophilus]SSY79604.1 chain length determinant protein WzzB [Alcaligenes 
MTSPSTPPSSVDQGPTIFDVLDALRNNKLPVILLSLAGIICAAAYLVIAEPRFRAHSTLTPPTPTDLVHFNTAIRSLGPEIDNILNEQPGEAGKQHLAELTPETAFQIFTRHLNSQKTLDEFFETVYLPHLNNTALPAQEREILREQFSRDLNILNSSPNGVPTATVTLSNQDPQLAKAWTNQFVTLALQNSRAEVLQTVQSTADLEKKTTDSQITALRLFAETERQAQISRIKDAHEIALSIALEHPSSTGNLITSYSGDNLYLRGTKALQAQLDTLEKRQNNDPYIPTLPPLKAKLDLLSSIDSTQLSGQVATIDQPAIEPSTPYQPRTLITLAIGLLGGFGIACLYVLTRLSYLFRQKPTAADQ